MVFAIAGLVIAFVLILAFRDPKTRHCRWRAQRGPLSGEVAYYKCMTCGAETITEDGKPPRQCLRDRPPPDF
ncbi:hypothetical protein [Marimonas lutisalis]|uniref:hypothetical protein n=1 Tax=Marimonas lutisalis TaxID=2545756 RepID=UPI0010F96E37|nr:hypothetical protein [Marimonas lutisalis]